MAYFALWALGCLILAGSLIALYKNITALKRSIQFQNQIKASKKNCSLAQGGWGLLSLEAAGAVFCFAMASQAQILQSEWQTQPDLLCFFSIGLFFIAKAAAVWNESRILFYKEGFAYQSQSYTWASLRSMEHDRGYLAMTFKKMPDLYIRNKTLIQALEENHAAWKKACRSR